MGFNSSLIVLNDGLDCIRNDKEYGSKVASAITRLSVHRGPIDISSGNHVNASSVIETHHADAMTVLAFGGNTARQLEGYFNWKDSDLTIVKELADRLGYRLVKKK